jgi:hypothetical protein
MKMFATALLTAAVMATPAFAVDSTTKTDTNVNTSVGTAQDSGVSLYDKSKVMPNSTLSTGDNDSYVRTNTDVETEATAEAEMNQDIARNSNNSESTSNRYNDNRNVHSYNDSGKKYGHRD